MKIKRPQFQVLMPIIAAVGIASWAFGLGEIFLYLHHTELGEWGAVIVGMILIFAIPGVVALVLNQARGKSKE